MNKTTFLQWDSNFFEYKVFKIEFDNETFLENEIQICYDKGAKLIYTFTKGKHLSDRILNRYNGKLVDVKIWYEKLLKAEGKIENEIIPLELYNGDFDKLLKLTYESGKYSRFNTDLLLPENTYTRLYKLWLERSIRKEYADEVLVYRSNPKQIEGFITLKSNAEFGEIGLIAVSDKMRGKKIGSKLLAKAESYLLEKQIYRMKVATQLDNKMACTFYEKNKYFVTDKIRIYHFHNN